MELYAYAVNANDNSPVSYATVQRRYPNGADKSGAQYQGGNYSGAIVADEQGYFNGRVPDNTYTWLITAAGYNPQEVDLHNAVADGTATIKMIPAGDLAPVVVTPGSGGSNKGTTALLAIGAAAAAAWYAHKKHWL